MRLPEWTQEDEAALMDRDVLKAARSVELAQLHIWCSIAVSLECIAVVLGGDAGLGEHEEAGMLQQLKDASVRDTSND